MLELAGPLAVAALVLAAGGLFKLRDPGPTREMFTSIGSFLGRGAAVLAVVSGMVEVTLGVATFVVGGRVLAVCTAASFALFAFVAWLLVRSPDRGSCGCFGRHSSETTWFHVTIDLAVAAAAATAAAVDAPGFVDARLELPAAGLPFIGLAVLGAWFVIAGLTVLPAVSVAARRGRSTPSVKTFQITSGA